MYQILIVEDEQRLAAFVEKGFRRKGFGTQVITDGEQALSEVQNFVQRPDQSSSFDLVVLDLGLPKIDGITILKYLRQQGCLVPVIVMTTASDVREIVLQAGANEYVAKPFRFQDLLDLVDHLLPKLT